MEKEIPTSSRIHDADFIEHSRQSRNKIGTIVLGGGCFWCTEAVFQMLKGIISIAPGYAGGTKENPTYEEICNGDTGHAEVIKIEYDSEVISLDDILTVFFGSHDPTQVNSQGNDVGNQYRSIILFSTEEQKEKSEKFIEDINNSNTMGKPIATEVKPLEKFYEAEEYHKNYYKNNPKQGYCQVIINPKLKKVQEKFKDLLENKKTYTRKKFIRSNNFVKRN